MNLEQLRTKYANKANETTVDASTTATTKELVRMPSLFGFANKTKQVAKTTASTVGGIMPATNRRVDSIASQFNSRMNDMEVKQWGQDVKIEMLAQLMGANLPSDEELQAAFMAQQNEKMIEEEAKKAEAAVEAVAPMMEKIMEMFTAMMGKTAEEEIVEIHEIHEDEIVEIIEEVVEEKPKKKAAPKKKQEAKEEEAPKGRRRIKRGAPLAE